MFRMGQRAVVLGRSFGLSLRGARTAAKQKGRTLCRETCLICKIERQRKKNGWTGILEGRKATVEAAGTVIIVYKVGRSAG